MSNTVVLAAQAVVEKAFEGTGYELVDLEFKKERSGWNLIIYADKPEGLSLDDCEEITHLVDPLLDEDPEVSGKHDHLIVSSPGLDRPMKTTRDFERHIGEKIELKLLTPYDKKREMAGILTAVDEDKIELAIAKRGREQQVTMPRSNIALARLCIEFD
ncbi:MAG: ribosome maturation factor RimP [Eubacteriales bacterium]|nr:ribosome maturation factor RimP [Eubacteriales bacterium]